MIPVSATRVLNNFQEPPEPFENTEAMARIHSARLHNKFAVLDRGNVLKQIESKRTSGILLHAMFPGRVPADSGPRFTFRESIMIALVTLSDARKELLKHLLRKMASFY